MQVIRARFDGQVLIPQSPPALAAGSEVQLLVAGDASEMDAQAADAAMAAYYSSQSDEERAEEVAFAEAALRDRAAFRDE